MMKMPMWLSLLVLSAASPAIHAMPVCLFAEASDADGDGWGWENNASCRVVLSIQSCVDTDGDGWGWDGVGTCVVSSGPDSTAANSAPDSNAVGGGQCVDTDGDGWGWDGQSSCRLTDVASADSVQEPIDSENEQPIEQPIEQPVFVDETQPTAPSVIQTDPNDGRFLDWAVNGYASVDSVATDANWSRCYAVVNSQAAPWETAESDCVCMFTDDEKEEYEINERLPQYATHKTTGQVCVYNRFLSYGSAAVPVYAVGESDTLQRLEFSRVELSDLYLNGNDWQCTEDTRDSLDGVFVSGKAADLTFGAGGDATFTIDGITRSGSWKLLNSGYATNTTRIEIEHQDDLILAVNPQLDGDQLVLYRTAFNRLSCQQIASDYPFNRFSIDATTVRSMWDSVGSDTLSRLNGDQLNGRTFQCAALEGEFDTNQSGPGYAFSTASDDEIVVPIVHTRTQQVTNGTGQIGQFKSYSFGDYFGGFNEYGSSGGGFSSSYDALVVYRYSNNLSLIDYSCCFVHGGAASEDSLWACRDIGGPSLCVDEDGDGFGWNGFGSCTP